MTDETPSTNNVVPCPYANRPATSFWRKSFSKNDPADLDPVVAPRFSITPEDRVATAGSCFAQHISRFIRNSGFNYFVTEPGHPILPQPVLEAFNFGTFSARYGNIYTVRQLLQLFERAYGLRQPVDDVWRDDTTGRMIDPFRPFIQGNGFNGVEEYEADRKQHFAAIRCMVEEADVFVFTLGLTECWENTQDGSVYAICPGCGAGCHEQGQSRFHNFTITEIIEDLVSAIRFMRVRNSKLRVLLTVSPVPLIATFEDKHVLTATTYSKSVLRVAAQMAVDALSYVDYFPSYEIITSAFSRGAYYDEDLREVREEGVWHAMRCLFRNYYGHELSSASRLTPTQQACEETRSMLINRIVCDEEQLDYD